MARHIDKAEYGLVQVVEGKDAGRIAYYAHDSQDARYAVVCFRLPRDAPSVLIPRAWLRSTDDVPEKLAQWKRDHPAMVASLELDVP